MSTHWPTALLTAVFIGLVAPELCAGGKLPRRALRFDGVDDFVRVPFENTLDPIAEVTLETWLYPEATDKGGIAGLWGNGGLPDKVLLYLDQAAVVGRIALAGGGGHKEVSANVRAGRWIHVALTYDGTELCLYLNAVKVDSTPVRGDLESTDVDFRMGIEDIFFGDDPAYLNGRLDEVRYWRTGRSADQVFEGFRHTLQGDTPGLLGRWNLDEEVADQDVLDATPFAHHGTLGTDANVGADDPARGDSDAPIRWADLGLGLAGTHGIPQLVGTGPLIGGLPIELRLSGALPVAPAVLFIGLGRIDAPFKGGILVPTPDQILPGFFTDAAGSINLGANWPNALPPCFSLYYQWWIADAAGILGYSASNGLWSETD